MSTDSQLGSSNAPPQIPDISGHRHVPLHSILPPFLPSNLVQSCIKSSFHPSARPLTIHPSEQLTIHPSVHSSIHQFIYPAIHPSLHSPIHPFIYPAIHSHPSTHPYIYSSIQPSIHIHPLTYTSIHLSSQPSVPPLAHTCIHLSSQPSVNPLTHTSIHLSSHLFTSVHSPIHHPLIRGQQQNNKQHRTTDKLSLREIK